MHDKRAVTKTTARKIRENRLRRMAEQQGFALQRSRRRDPHAVDFGRYRLVYRGAVVYGARPRDFSLTLDDVEKWLTSPRLSRRRRNVTSASSRSTKT